MVQWLTHGPEPRRAPPVGGQGRLPTGAEIMFSPARMYASPARRTVRGERGERHGCCGRRDRWCERHRSRPGAAFRARRTREWWSPTSRWRRSNGPLTAAPRRSARSADRCQRSRPGRAARTRGARPFRSCRHRVQQRGITTFNLLEHQTLDDWRWVFDVNLWGVVNGVRTFVPIMREQGTPATW